MAEPHFAGRLTHPPGRRSLVAAMQLEMNTGECGGWAMADVTADMDAEHAASLGRRYLIKFEEDTLRPRPQGGALPVTAAPAPDGH
jgi:hypothetical protein